MSRYFTNPFSTRHDHVLGRLQQMIPDIGGDWLTAVLSKNSRMTTTVIGRLTSCKLRLFVNAQIVPINMSEKPEDATGEHLDIG